MKKQEIGRALRKRYQANHPVEVLTEVDRKSLTIYTVR
jgi:hypothetical protein